MKQTDMEKSQVISSFLEVNKIEREGTIAQFRAVVEYMELAICDVTTVQVKLDPIRFGDIDVYETSRINMGILHTGFSAPYHEYQLENLTLVIKGTASIAKGGKDYSVRITPVNC